jgi:hypothetical protein
LNYKCRVNEKLLQRQTKFTHILPELLEKGLEVLAEIRSLVVVSTARLHVRQKLEKHKEGLFGKIKRVMIRPVC